ncbi:hypothetical protein FDP41_010660 [Naegleria fowleri]|uniref:DDE Tnp4 domain-containing protein n=1 Tax=Naegleria fowleri TaxID=5763 RepID=A0A6A5BW90_NAEFO|nr:uncharacterized protein FDP41_002653 [Naegleria fowleri]XP_044568308.1 uncharacterized protein FDP41_010660 [Naegleria fowleri]KAF0978138.1 hypothetical protein FDP41_002653 [Naegleria fowleri]KAF0983595.1 hypothetical protein FDP41_010660 [Naegleria fowleri]
MSLDISKEDAVRLREIEVKKLVANEWKVLHEELPIIQKSKGRKDIKDIPTMNRIKEIVCQRIGYVATFIFLHTVGTICGWLEGPYRNVDKILLILYMLLENETFGSLNERRIIARSTIWRIHHTIFVEFHDQLNEWADTCLQRMFSNPIIRCLTGIIENEKGFKDGTTFLDGHDTRIEYSNLAKYPKREYWSYKYKDSGLRTQVLMDNQELAIAISKSLPCAPNTDIGMFKQMERIPKLLDPSVDVLYFDGGYFLGIPDYIEKLQEKGYDLDESNFRTPIRKPRNQDLTYSEAQYNEEFGAFRGMIETLFSHIGEKFKFFNPHSVAKMSGDLENVWNLKLHLCCLTFIDS